MGRIDALLLAGLATAETAYEVAFAFFDELPNELVVLALIAKLAAVVCFDLVESCLNDPAGKFEFVISLIEFLEKEIGSLYELRCPCYSAF